MVGYSRSTFRILLVLLVFSTISQAFAGGSDWVTFKGNFSRTSYTTNYVEPAIQKVKWQFTTDGAITASPVCSGNYIYVPTEKGYFYCLDANSGSQSWKFPDSRLSEFKDEEGNTPWPSGDLDFKKYKLTLSCTIYDRYIFLPYGQMLLIIDINSGRLKARYDISSQKATFTTTPIISASHQTIVCGASNGYMYGLDYNVKDVTKPRDPPIRWRLPEPSGTGDVIESSPALFGNRIYFGSNSKSVYCLELKLPFSQSQGIKTSEKPEAVWSTKLDGPITSSPALSKDKVIVCSSYGKVYALSQSAGAKLWTYDIGGTIESSPAVAFGRVVVVSNKTVTLLDETTGKELASTIISAKSVSTPAIGGTNLENSYVYLTSTDGKVYALYLKNLSGASTKRMDGTTIKSSPSISQSKLIFGTAESDGRLVALEHGEDPPKLMASKKQLDFYGIPPNTNVNKDDEIYFENIGGGKLSVDLVSTRNWITMSPDTFTLDSGESKSIRITINTVGLKTGKYPGIIKATSNGGTASIPINVQIDEVPDTQIMITVGQSQIWVNGQPKTIEAPPYFSKNGNPMVPLRFITEAFECQNKWDSATKTVTVIYSKKGITVTIKIGSTISTIKYERTGRIETVIMSDPPEIVKGRTFVPLWFMVSAFDAKVVKIDPNRYKIIIKGY